MPPHEDEPLWPSADTDETESAPGGEPESEAAPGADESGEQPTQPQKLPKVTLEDQPTMWVKSGQSQQSGQSQKEEPAPQEMTQQMPIVLPWVRQPSSEQNGSSEASPDQSARADQGSPGHDTDQNAPGEAGQDQAGQAGSGQTAQAGSGQTAQAGRSGSGPVGRDQAGSGQVGQDQVGRSGSSPAERDEAGAARDEAGKSGSGQAAQAGSSSVGQDQPGPGQSAQPGSGQSASGLAAQSGSGQSASAQSGSGRSASAQSAQPGSGQSASGLAAQPGSSQSASGQAGPDQPTLFTPVPKPAQPRQDQNQNQNQPTIFTPVPKPPQPGPGQDAPGRRLEDQPTLFTPIPHFGQPTPNQAAGRPQAQRTPIPPAGSVHARPMRIDPSGDVRPAEGAGHPQDPAQTPEAAAGETPVIPPPDADAQPTAEPRRKKRGLIYSGAALLLVIVVGVALALPYVSNRLGLPWAPNLPKSDTPQPATVNLALHAPSPGAPTPATGGVSGALAGPSGNATLGTLTGIVIDPATGDVLWNHDSGQLLTPASTTKILTTSAALLQLDHGLQLPTKVVQGSSPDTAIIVAGGDLTLSSLPDGKESVYQGAAHLDDLVSQVKQAGGGTIKKVQIDLSAYTGAATAPGWAPEDTPSTYATQIVPAMLDGGMSDPSNDHSMRTGNPAGDLLQTFAQRLGASVATTSTAKAPPGAKVLGEVKSAPLTELISQLLQHSDNELAEVVARQTAIGTGQPPSFAGGAQATLAVLSQNGFDVSGVSLNDGSGLSTLNKVPARLLAQLISVAAAPEGKDPRTAKLRPLLEGLPVAGGSGTLADRYGDPNSSAGKGWIRAKTGTLSGVNTLAGVVLDKDGRVLVFALMSNNNGDINATRAALDAVAAKLRGCGCQ